MQENIYQSSGTRTLCLFTDCIITTLRAIVHILKQAVKSNARLCTGNLFCHMLSAQLCKTLFWTRWPQFKRLKLLAS